MQLFKSLVFGLACMTISMPMVASEQELGKEPSGYEKAQQFVKKYGVKPSFWSAYVTGLTLGNPISPLSGLTMQAYNFGYLGVKTLPEALDKDIPSGVVTFIWDNEKLGCVDVAGILAGLFTKAIFIGIPTVA